jgi:hypothetical protein
VSKCRGARRWSEKSRVRALVRCRWKRELLFIRVDVSITCGATESHGRGHLTSSPPNSVRSDSRFFFRAVSSKCALPPSVIVLVSVCERGVLGSVRAVLFVFECSHFHLRRCVRVVYKTRLRNHHASLIAFVNRVFSFSVVCVAS